MTHGAIGSGHGYQRRQMPNALRIGLLGPLQERDETGRPVRIGGRQLRVLLSLLALNAGRVVPAGSLARHIWSDDPPGHPGNTSTRPDRATRSTPSSAAVLPNRLTSPVASIALAVVASYRMNPIVGHAAVRTRTAACQRGREVPCGSCQSR